MREGIIVQAKKRVKKSSKKYVNDIVKHANIVQKQGFLVGLTKYELNKEDALKENSSFHEFAIYTFKKEVDLWKFLGEIRSRAELKKKNKAVKCSYDLLGNQVTLIFPKDVLMKDIAPLIKGLNVYGYNGDKINFMRVN